MESPCVFPTFNQGDKVWANGEYLGDGDRQMKVTQVTVSWDKHFIYYVKDPVYPNDDTWLADASVGSTYFATKEELNEFQLQ